MRDRLGLLHGLVEALAEPWTACREVLDLVEELCARLVKVANGFHRW